MGKKRKKEKQRKFIAKITKDGKVSKKEARKAAKKGISLAKIERAAIRSFRDEQRSYQRTPTERRRSTAPSYSPLLISRGADRVFNKPRPQTTSSPQSTTGGAAGGGGNNGSSAPAGPTNQYQGEIDQILSGQGGPNQAYLDVISDLQNQIANIEMPEMPDYGAQIAEMQAAQDAYMRELAEQQAAAERERELAFRTSQENVARGGLTPDFRIGSPFSRDRMGTSGFKRRRRKRLASVVAQGISPASQAIANMVPNTLPNRGISI